MYPEEGKRRAASAPNEEDVINRLLAVVTQQHLPLFLQPHINEMLIGLCKLILPNNHSTQTRLQSSECLALCIARHSSLLRQLPLYRELTLCLHNVQRIIKSKIDRKVDNKNSFNENEDTAMLKSWRNLSNAIAILDHLDYRPLSNSFKSLQNLTTNQINDLMISPSKRKASRNEQGGKESIAVVVSLTENAGDNNLPTTISDAKRRIPFVKSRLIALKGVLSVMISDLSDNGGGIFVIVVVVLPTKAEKQQELLNELKAACGDSSRVVAVRKQRQSGEPPNEAYADNISEATIKSEDVATGPTYLEDTMDDYVDEPQWDHSSLNHAPEFQMKKTKATNDEKKTGPNELRISMSDATGDPHGLKECDSVPMFFNPASFLYAESRVLNTYQLSLRREELELARKLRKLKNEKAAKGKSGRFAGGRLNRLLDNWAI